MRIFLTSIFVPVAGHAHAHPGHIEALAGHDHWIAIGAIAAAGVIGLIGLLKGKDDAPEDDPEDGVPEDLGA